MARMLREVTAGLSGHGIGADIAGTEAVSVTAGLVDASLESMVREGTGVAAAVTVTAWPEDFEGFGRLEGWTGGGRSGSAVVSSGMGVA